MAKASGIAWTKSTFNPWVGCTKISPACDNCYAATMDARKVFKGVTHWGANVPRMRTAETTWNQVRSWNKEAPNTEFAGRKGFWPVFSASLADIFDNEIPPEWRADFWALVKECSNLTFLIVTKRIGNAKTMLPPDWGSGYPNVWLISTVENQEVADRDIPKLLDIPAVIHGLSVEPLLGRIDLTRIRPKLFAATANALTGKWKWDDGPTKQETPRIDWVITGAESSLGARPTLPDFFYSLRDQCKQAGVAFFHKQNGEWHTSAYLSSTSKAVFRQFDSFEQWCNKARSWVMGGICLDRHGVELKRGADFMRARDDGSFPVTIMHRVGTDKSGRLLDGALHDEFPVPRPAA